MLTSAIPRTGGKRTKKLPKKKKALFGRRRRIPAPKKSPWQSFKRIIRKRQNTDDLGMGKNERWAGRLKMDSKKGRVDSKSYRFCQITKRLKTPKVRQNVENVSQIEGSALQKTRKKLKCKT